MTYREFLDFYQKENPTIVKMEHSDFTNSVSDSNVGYWKISSCTDGIIVMRMFDLEKNESLYSPFEIDPQKIKEIEKIR